MHCKPSKGTPTWERLILPLLRPGTVFPPPMLACALILPCSSLVHVAISMKDFHSKPLDSYSFSTPLPQCSQSQSCRAVIQLGWGQAPHDLISASLPVVASCGLSVRCGERLFDRAGNDAHPGLVACSQSRLTGLGFGRRLVCGFTCGPWIGVTRFPHDIKTSASSYASLRRHGFSISSSSCWNFHLTCAVNFLPNPNKIVSSFLLSSFPIYFINQTKNPEKREPQFPSTRPEKEGFLREGVRRAIEPRHRWGET